MRDYRFTEMANEDLQGIFDYISTNLSAPDAASNLIDEIEQQINRICEFPLTCPLLEDAILRDKGYRRLNVQNFSLFYLIDDNLLIVERVLYGRRHFERLL